MADINKVGTYDNSQSKDDQDGEFFVVTKSNQGRVGKNPANITLSWTRLDDKIYLRADCENNPEFWFEAKMAATELENLFTSTK